MSPERWRQVEELYHSALECEPARRTEFLTKACNGDDGLRREVESLLAQPSGDGPLARPAWEGAGTLLELPVAQIVPNAQLGPYKIEALIGEGGMGSVYRAIDTKLNRAVAIKFLSGDLADAEARRRFQREAQLASSLNHPHILTVHDAGEIDGRQYLVTEYIDGGTLRDWAREQKRTWKQVVELLTGVADGLAAAHEAKIVHRDIKPGNILVAKNGYAKLVDFGLAKLSEGSTVDLTSTLANGQTRPGLLMGTIAYMSPEQASSKPLDARSDIFSFGVVLYELLANRGPFTGTTDLEVLKTIIHAEASPLGEDSPLLLRSIVEKALEKDPAERYQTMRDMVADFRRLARAKRQEGPPAPTSPTNKPLDGASSLVASAPGLSVRGSVRASRLNWAGWITAALFALAALALAILHSREPIQSSTAVRLFFPPPANTSFRGYPALSSDGHFLAFVAGGQGQLWVRDMDSVTARPLPGAERAENPFWSFDSRSIGFFADGKLKKIDVAEGSVFTVCDVKNPRGATWNQNGTIIFAPDFGFNGLFSVSASGGTPVALTSVRKQAGELSHRLPWFMPDGEHFLYTARGQDINSSKVYLRSLRDKSEKLVLTVPSNVIYVPPGHILFVREGSLVAQRMDPSSGAVSGEEIPIGEQVVFSSLNVWGAIAASQTGVLAYIPRVYQNSQLTWFDRSGRMIEGLGDVAPVYMPRISPDGNAVAYGRLDPQTGFADVWIRNMERGTSLRFTAGLPASASSAWAPDGGELAFSAVHPAAATFFRKGVTSASVEQPLVSKDSEVNANNPRVEDWSSDKRYVVVEIQVGQNREDIWAIPSNGEKPFPVAQSQASERNARVSTNSQWLAYASDETGRSEVYVQNFPELGQKIQVSTTGGDFPVWSRDGKELYYIGADQKMMAVPVKSTTLNRKLVFEPGVPKALFAMRANGGFDVSKDGRFLIALPVEQSSPTPLTIVLNWQAVFKK